MYSVMGKLRGSKSASAVGEKKGRGGGIVARKSYANVMEKIDGYNGEEKHTHISPYIINS